MKRSKPRKDIKWNIFISWFHCVPNCKEKMGERPRKSHNLNNLLTQATLTGSIRIRHVIPHTCLLHRSRNKLTNRNQGLKLKANGSAWLWNFLCNNQHPWYHFTTSSNRPNLLQIQWQCQFSFKLIDNADKKTVHQVAWVYHTTLCPLHSEVALEVYTSRPKRNLAWFTQWIGSNILYYRAISLKVLRHWIYSKLPDNTSKKTY